MNMLIVYGVKSLYIMFFVIGDYFFDQVFLQAGQFEVGVDELSDGLFKFWLEGGGGG